MLETISSISFPLYSRYARGNAINLKYKTVFMLKVVSISERKRNRLEALELRQSISMNIKAVTIGTSATTTATSTSAATNISSSSTSLLRPPRHPVCNAKGMFNSSKPPSKFLISYFFNVLSPFSFKCLVVNLCSASSDGDFEGPTYAKLAKVVLDGPIASQLQVKFSLFSSIWAIFCKERKKDIVTSFKIPCM